MLRLITYRSDMRIEDVIRARDQGVEADVLVSPRSGRSGVEGIDEWRSRLIMKVKSPPLDGKANREVEEILSRMTDSKAEVISGHTSRQKTVFLKGDPGTIISKLRELDER
ncbi:MAG: DUF167 domain-containing protein [Candidatus Methanoplasma sp.]|jgi:uncharacterized protein (TIGR00251 family)|nr:DUF167 domain-containing protein [Candidatus Methanoplasma sp.]